MAELEELIKNPNVKVYFHKKGDEWEWGKATIEYETDMYDYTREKPIDLSKIWDRIEKENKCLHLGCSECHGTGRKKDGTICVHFISCRCPRCNPVRLCYIAERKEYHASLCNAN